MAATVALTIDKLGPELAALGNAISTAFRSEALRKKLAILCVAGVKDHFARGAGPDGTPWAPLKIRSGKPLRDTGRLANSTVATVTAQGITLSNNNVQAALMNAGGTVRAKGKYLAIPLTPEAQRAGSPRAVPGLHFQGRKGANKGVLADAEGRAVFALVPSVTVPKREFLGFSAKTMARVEQMIGDEVAKAVTGG